MRLAVRIKNARRRPAGPGGEGDGGAGPALAGRSPGVPTLAEPDPSALPDIVALPVWNVHVFRRGKRDFLGFAASSWNAGPGPLVVEGFRRPSEDVMDAFQYSTTPRATSSGAPRSGRWHTTRAAGTSTGTSFSS